MTSPPLLADLARAEPLFICRRGPEQWAGGMSSPVETFVPINYSPSVVLELVERVRVAEERITTLDAELAKSDRKSAEQERIITKQREMLEKRKP